MQRGQRDHLLLVAALGQAQDDADRLRDLEHALLLALERAAFLRDLAAAALGDPVDEVEHVAPARLRDLLGILAVVQMLLVADVLEPFHQHRLGRLGTDRRLRLVLEGVHVAAELVQAVDRLGLQRDAQRLGEQRLEHAHLPLAGELAERAQRGVADAALGRGHRAQEGRVVVLVDDQAQPAAQVLDLGAIEEALAAGDLVRDLRRAQLLLEHARLVVGAVQDREVGELHAAVVAAQRLDARHGTLGLVLLAVALNHLHRLAFAVVAPQLLGEDLRVQRDHFIGRAQDGAGGAVVLLQRDHLQRGVLGRQALQVVDGGAAPAVDALVVVAHGREARTFRIAHQLLEQFVLHRVRVLVFVDQHVLEQLLPLRARLLVSLQQLQRKADQVVEVDGAVGGEALFVELHHACGHLLVGILGRRGRHVARDARVLPQADGPLPLARELVVGGAAGVLEHAHHVVRVEDGELRLQAQLGAVLAQHAHAQRVERADRQVLRGLGADELLGALAHFLRRLVGERDGRDVLRRQAVLQQPHDLVRDHARLARTRAGQHQARAVEVVHRLHLGVVQPGRGGGRRSMRRTGIGSGGHGAGTGNRNSEKGASPLGGVAAIIAGRLAPDS